MNKISNIKTTILFVLSVSLIVAAIITFLLTIYYQNACFQMLNGFSEKIIQHCPDSRQTVLEIVKTRDYDTTKETVLSTFGYRPSHLELAAPAVLWIASLGFAAGAVLFLVSFWYWHKKSAAQIQTLTDYLEKINTGARGLLLDTSENQFSRLQDEIYKTVTTLYQTRDAALAARKKFAENLSNIAHQLKTPIASISLSIQMEKEQLGDVRVGELERQINRLTYLEESLLTLSRIDAGTLTLDRKPTDVFTLLTLASDNLYELFTQKGVWIDVPELEEMNITVDTDWTMEAIMNLMKNCLEAADAGSTVHCSYEKNPLYVQIRIWDEGQGFAKEELPHLFERFYRGKKARNTGIGIGLSLAKEMIEMQNGIIRAFNLRNSGACFEIRFYSHLDVT